MAQVGEILHGASSFHEVTKAALPRSSPHPKSGQKKKKKELKQLQMGKPNPDASIPHIEFPRVSSFLTRQNPAGAGGDKNPVALH